MLYTVGRIAKLLDIAPSTLRYYDKEGLMPFVERSEGGIRVFQERDLEWLRIIECLKKSGMPLKHIKQFIELAMQGDGSIEERYSLFLKQREIVKAQIEELEKTLEILDYKCWYYETAKSAGTTSIPRNMQLEEIPEQFHNARQSLRRTNG